MNGNPICKLIVTSNITELQLRYESRYSTPSSAESLAFLCNLVANPDGPSVGGTDESPWSDETWLAWIHNRLIDLETASREDLRKRFIRRVPLLRVAADWSRFLDEYHALSIRVARLEDWKPPSRDGYQPATEGDIADTEKRLSVRFPRSLRAFYLATNGWPADGWLKPTVNPLNELNYLKVHDVGLFELADEAERTEGPWPDDPEDSRIREYRFEQGTRVKRSIALTYKTDDTETVLVDPESPREDSEWPCGSWAHWNPAMEWSYGSFADYMRSRYDYLAEMEHGI